MKIGLGLILILLGGVAYSQQLSYQKPPAEIASVIETPLAPSLAVSPTKDFALILERARYGSITEFAKPMLRMAGYRINPENRAPAREIPFTSIQILDLKLGSARPVQLPASGLPYEVEWSPDGSKFSVLIATPTSLELGIVDVSTASLKVLPIRLNGGLDNPAKWMPNSNSLLVRVVPPNQGLAPATSGPPIGPEIQESNGKRTPARTSPDVLTDSNADEQFTYYMSSRLAILDLASNSIRMVGPLGIVAATVSPDGNLLLVDQLAAPYSRKVYADGFARTVSVLNLKTGKETPVAHEPAEDGIPIDGVITGPRQIQWKPNEPACLFWVEALDGGDPRAKAEFRDRLVAMDVSTGQNRELAKLPERFMVANWCVTGDRAVIEEFAYETERIRMSYLNANALSLLSDVSEQEIYAAPGAPLITELPNGQHVLRQEGDEIFLHGEGGSPTGSHPFLDRVNLRSGAKERLWQCDADHYEILVNMIDPTKLVTRRESPTEYPNFFIRNLKAGGGAGQDDVKPLTTFKNTHPEIIKITKKLIRYKRSDGVDLSFTLYLPPNYRPGERLPAVAEAYPLEYVDAATAGQFSGSLQRFPTLSGHLLFLLAGYAVLSNVTMPIVGPPKTVNDSFVDQLCLDADAAVKAAAETGAVDAKRIGVMGHSYGAFMTANLMAHSTDFKAGCAESGAYNRSLTPFGFQSERRTFWDAPEMYARVSPFSYANQFKGPILLIHGEQDNNQGTFTIQSERLYQALSGNGAITRLVLLPFEAHGYAAKESVEHVVWEELRWFDKYVKGM